MPIEYSEIKERIADKYTAAELCEVLEVPVEVVLDSLYDYVIDNIEELGVLD